MLLFAAGCVSLFGLNMLSADVFKTPIFLVFAPKPLLKRANLDGVDVMLLCRDSFLVLDEDSFVLESFALEVIDCAVLFALLLDWILDEEGGKEPDLFDQEYKLIDTHFIIFQMIFLS